MRAPARKSNGIDSTNLIMTQSHPRRQPLFHSQDIPQRIYLEFIKRLVRRVHKQRLELVASVFDLILLQTLVLSHLRFCEVCGFGEAELLRREVQETGLDGFDGPVDYGVYGVDYVVNEGLDGG